MSSEAITRNDLANILNEVLPAQPEKPPTPKGYGVPVDITAYSSASSKYAVPADGLVLIQCSYRSGQYIYGRVFNADDTNEVFIQLTTGGSNMQGNQQAVIPVFKGQRVYIQTNNTTYNFGQFIPFIY